MVVQTCNDIGGGPSWPEPVKRDFETYVGDGGGVYIFHAAENAFVGWRDYEETVGLCWRKQDFGTAIRVTEDGHRVRVKLAHIATGDHAGPAGVFYQDDVVAGGGGMER